MNKIHHSMAKFVSFLLSIFLDIQFWRNRKTLEGLSVRSVFFNVFQSVIVLLYVMDNETNTVIIISCFVGLLIEIWKINKAVDIKVIEPFTEFFILSSWVMAEVTGFLYVVAYYKLNGKLQWSLTY